MLQEIRQNSRHAIIYVLFGVLIAAFIISFGPHSGTEGGCGQASASYAAKVAGSTISEEDWKFAMVGSGFTRIRATDMRSQRVKEYVMDKLVERAILAHEADKMGFKVSTEEAEDMIKTGYVLILGHKFNVQREIFAKDGGFKYNKFKNYARTVTDSEKEFMAEQRTELMADKVRQLMKGSVLLSPEEVENHFKAENSTVAFDYVRFSAAAYEREVVLSEADIAAYLAAHEVDVKAKYEKDKPLMYKGQPPEIRTSHIRVDAAKDALPPMVDAAKAKADKLYERVTKGGEAFAAVAESASDDSSTRHHGGDLRWRSDNMLGLGPDVDAAVKKLKAGEISPVVRGDDGFEIIKVEKRMPAGDRAYDDVKHDIAQTMALGDKAKAAAKTAAEAALAKLQAEKLKQPTATLDVMFEREQKGDNDLPPDILKSLKLPPGVHIKSSQGGGGGAMELNPTTAPAGGETAPAGGAPVPAPAPTTAPAPAGGGSGKANPGPQAMLAPWGALGRDLNMTQTEGSKPAPAAKPAKPAAKPAKPAPAALGVTTAPAKPAPAALGVTAAPQPAGSPLSVTAAPAAGGPAPDQLPVPADATAAKPLPRDPTLPKIEEAGPVTRAEALDMEEIAKSPKVVNMLFEQVEAKAIAPSVVEAGDAYLIIYVRAKSKPDMDDFGKRKAEIARNYQDNKAADVYHQWVEARCLELAKGNDISFNKNLVAYESDTPGRGLETNYEPCKSGALEH